MQKIDERNIQTYGTSGLGVSIPKSFARDNNLSKGMKIDIFRTQVEINGNHVDALIYVPKKTQTELAKAILAEHEV
jgi:phosphate uptake regulator